MPQDGNHTVNRRSSCCNCEERIRVCNIRKPVYFGAMTTVLPIRVTTRSAKPGIGSWRADADGREELEVRVAEAPAYGAANDAVIKLLAKALGTSRSELSIISGHASRHKRVETPFELSEARRRLGG